MYSFELIDQRRSLWLLKNSVRQPNKISRKLRQNGGACPRAHIQSHNLKAAGDKNQPAPGREITTMSRFARRMDLLRSEPRMWAVRVTFREWRANVRAVHGRRSSG